MLLLRLLRRALLCLLYGWFVTSLAERLSPNAQPTSLTYPVRETQLASGHNRACAGRTCRYAITMVTYLGRLVIVESIIFSEHACAGSPCPCSSIAYLVHADQCTVFVSGASPECSNKGAQSKGWPSRLRSAR